MNISFCGKTRNISPPFELIVYSFSVKYGGGARIPNKSMVKSSLVIKWSHIWMSTGYWASFKKRERELSRQFSWLFSIMRILHNFQKIFRVTKKARNTQQTLTTQQPAGFNPNKKLYWFDLKEIYCQFHSCWASWKKDSA